MSDIDFYLDGLSQLPAVIERGEDSQQEFAVTMLQFLQLEHLYESAINIVTTYLNNLDGEFNVRFQRNPIHNIESRVKSAESIVGKLQKKGLPITPESARRNLLDLAGISCLNVNERTMLKITAVKHFARPVLIFKNKAACIESYDFIMRVYI